MSRVFGDTFYFIALLNRADAHHAQATKVSEQVRSEVVTTTWVLTEVADAFAARTHRPLFLHLLELLSAPGAGFHVVPPSQQLFAEGISCIDPDWTRSGRSPTAFLSL